MTDKAKIIEKVRKLLALAERETTNEHEAALAAQRAQEILAEYNIELYEVKDHRQEADVTQSNVMTPVNPWQRRIRNAVATMYFCEYFYMTKNHFDEKTGQYKKASKRDYHCYVGEEHNIIVAQLMSEYLVQTGIRLMFNEQKQYPKSEHARFRKSFLNSYALVLRDRIWQRIRESKEKATPMGDGRNLPALRSLYDDARERNRRYLANQGIHLRTAKGRSRSSHLGGSMAGAQAGRDVSLDQQVDGTSKAVGKIGRG